ncbi:UNC93-like protein 1 [Vitis vinifera]|uniref:UNC93-like protein 1 n=1 Tax=Vitis vinifera TaxID=29760 RepID=A0A438E0R8_VITVI|nr:UNC93-like protein 1 [Vitis vinifera]
MTMYRTIRDPRVNDLIFWEEGKIENWGKKIIWGIGEYRNRRIRGLGLIRRVRDKPLSPRPRVIPIPFLDLFSGFESDSDLVGRREMGFGEDEESVVGLPNKSIFRYNSPLVQVCLIGLVCFCCPGMFNALSGMGGGGQVDATAANNANTALYTTFAIFGVLVVASTTSSVPASPSSPVAQPTSFTPALSFTTTTTSTRPSPLSPAPSSESEQDCSGRGRELS